MMVAMQRVMLDSNVVDKLLADEDLLASILAAVAAGRLGIVVTHVQRDELAAVSAGERRMRLLEVLERVAPASVATAGFVLDLSRLDHARLFDDDAASRHRGFVGRSRRRAKDALILATAEAEGLPVVTCESKARNLRRFRTWFPAVDMLGLEDLRELARGSQT